jgi:ATP-binding cassette subfamily B protein
MLRKFFSYYRPHRRLFFTDLLCAFSIALISLFYPFITRNIINDYVPNKSLQLILVWGGVLLAIYVIKMFLNYFVQYWGHVMGVRIQADMRRDFFHHIQLLPFSFFDENKTGTIMSRIINDLFEIGELAHHGPEDLFTSVITLGGALIMVALINPYLTLILLVVIPFMFWFAIVQRKKMKQSFTEMRAQTGEINASVESSVSGIRVSRAYTATEHELDKFDHANARFVDARNKAYKRMGIFGSGMGMFTDLLYFVALLGGALFFYFDLISGGDFTGYILYVSMIIAPVRTLTAIFESIQGGMSGFARFNEIMVKPAEIENPNAVDVEKLNGNIAFNNVSFRYDTNVKGDDFVLHNVSFNIKAGETVALVGPSGGGKTTMCHLIPRFYELNGGNITIDGYDITDLSRISLRRNIGIVQQDVFLFGGSIKENIAYGNLAASDDDIVEAAKKANIHDYILTLPDGYNTEVGERGVKLSGGQKQRISIARAFLKNPPILILDEATSALDNVTEMLIQESLDNLSVGRTTLVVAHRLSTIKNADEIMVVTSEGIAERGTHEQLMAQNGMYADLYNRQFRVTL